MRSAETARRVHPAESGCDQMTMAASSGRTSGARHLGRSDVERCGFHSGFAAGSPAWPAEGGPKVRADQSAVLKSIRPARSRWWHRRRQRFRSWLLSRVPGLVTNGMGEHRVGESAQMMIQPGRLGVGDAEPVERHAAGSLRWRIGRASGPMVGPLGCGQGSRFGFVDGRCGWRVWQWCGHQVNVVDHGALAGGTDERLLDVVRGALVWSGGRWGWCREGAGLWGGDAQPAATRAGTRRESGRRELCAHDSSDQLECHSDGHICRRPPDAVTAARSECQLLSLAHSQLGK